MPGPIDLESVRAKIKTEKIAGAAKDANTQRRPSDPTGFKMKDVGLFYKDSMLTGPFDVLAETCGDEQPPNWGLLLAWRDRDNREVKWIMSRGLLSGELIEVRRRRLEGGLYLSGEAGAAQLLRRDLLEVQTSERVRTVARCGWYDTAPSGAAFVLPDRTLGSAPGLRLMLNADRPQKIYRTNGTLKGWQEGVGSLAEGNTRLVFAICIGLAAPLVYMTGEETGGVHFRGGSSLGKTTAAKAAASLNGAPSGAHSYIRQWRSTDNGLEDIACERGDALLVLDEIGQADPRDIGQMAYMLSGGHGKGRSSAAGGLRDTPSWRLLFLSTGEMSLSDFLARAGSGGVKAGQEVRFLDLPIEAGAGFGAFETVSSKQEAEALADELQRAAAAHHGWAGPAFIEWIAARVGADWDWLPSRWRASRTAFRANYLPAGSDGQVERAMRRFALAAFAGELASEAGIVPWERTEAERAARACFQAWLDQRGTHGAREDQQVAQALRLFIQLHGKSRFEVIGVATGSSETQRVTEGARVSDMAGYRKLVTDNPDNEPRWLYGMTPAVFAEKICQPLGVEPREARKMLARLELIRTEARGNENKVRYEVRWNVPGIGRIYLVTIDGDRAHGDPE